MSATTDSNGKSRSNIKKMSAASADDVFEVTPASEFCPPGKARPKSFSVASAAVCRICHSGENSIPFNVGSQGEPLISPCFCRGTMGLYHRTCLEQWLTSSNSAHCEICKFKYVVQRTPKPIVEFLKNPGSQSTRRNLIGDLFCLLFLTPLALSSSILCIWGASATYDINRRVNGDEKGVQSISLICLGIFLLLTYTVWLMISLRYNYKVLKRWRRRNHYIRVLDVKEFRKLSCKKKSTAQMAPVGIQNPLTGPDVGNLQVASYQSASRLTLNSPDFFDRNSRVATPTINISRNRASPSVLFTPRFAASSHPPPTPQSAFVLETPPLSMQVPPLRCSTPRPRAHTPPMATFQFSNILPQPYSPLWDIPEHETDV